MKRIVFIAANETHLWGGSEHCWSAAAERLARNRVQVSVSVKNWTVPAKQVEHLRAAGCRVFLRRLPSLPERIGRRLFRRTGYEWPHVRRIATGADLVVISQGGNNDGLAWMEAAQSQGFKYAVISQSASEQWWPGDDEAERLGRCYEGASTAYFVSGANLALSRLQFVAPLSRGRVIRNPFNVRYDARPSWPGDPSKGLSLACVGRLEIAQKAQDLLMQVLNLAHWRERNIRITLAGSGVNEGTLRKIVDNLRLTNVEFAGFVGNIEQLWGQHHALVLPSRYEGMPLALVEAMLCGRPSIVTDVAGHRELVRDNVNGFLAKAPTVGFLDEAMNRAWENRHRLREMGEVAAKDVREWVSPDPTGDFVRELEALVDGRNS